MGREFSTNKSPSLPAHANSPPVPRPLLPLFSRFRSAAPYARRPPSFFVFALLSLCVLRALCSENSFLPYLATRHSFTPSECEGHFLPPPFFSYTYELPNLQLLCFEILTTVVGTPPPAALNRQKEVKNHDHTSPRRRNPLAGNPIRLYRS